jgi:hypothetical protein
MVRVSITAYASVTFNISARIHAKAATELDKAALVSGLSVNDPAFLERSETLQAVTLGSVLCSYMAIEAIVNELYMEADLMPAGTNFKGIRPDVARALLDSWHSGADRWPIVTKCHAATSTFGVSPIDFGKGPAQQFLRLSRLRHALVHHKLVTVDHGKPVADSDDKLEKDLHGAFPLAEIWVGRGVSFRWAGCLGAGCANWAYTTSQAFQAEVFGSLGIAYPKP